MDPRQQDKLRLPWSNQTSKKTASHPRGPRSSKVTFGAFPSCEVEEKTRRSPGLCSGSTQRRAGERAGLLGLPGGFAAPGSGMHRHGPDAKRPQPSRHCQAQPSLCRDLDATSLQALTRRRNFCCL